MNNLEQELKKIYDSEINVHLDSFWDGGWHIQVGDNMNGFHDAGYGYSIEEVIPTLKELIKQHYPQSDYAKSLLSQPPQGE